MDVLRGALSTKRAVQTMGCSGGGQGAPSDEEMRVDSLSAATPLHPPACSIATH
jgi:hypothetical protein